MKIVQEQHVRTLYGIRIPAYALTAYQQPTATRPARYVWVQDVTTCGYERFRIWCMNCATDEVYSYFGDVRKDSTARLFAKFADSLPLDCIRKPIWDKAGDIRACGPKDRKVSILDSRAKPQNSKVMTDRSVVDGCKVGPRIYTQEAYYTVVLNPMTGF